MAASFKHSKNLFTSSNGSNMVFFMRPCEERQKLRPMIEHGGGRVTSKVTKDSIKLAEMGSVVSSSDYLSSKFVHDCIKDNKLKNMSNYRAKPGQKHNDSTDDLDIEDDMDPAPVIKTTSRDMKGRQKYTLEDDQAIINFICTEKRYNEVMGNKLWDDMEKLKITDHPASSMNCRYRKVILPTIKQYNIPHTWVSLLTGDAVQPREYSPSVLYPGSSKKMKPAVCTLLDTRTEKVFLTPENMNRNSDSTNKDTKQNLESSPKKKSEKASATAEEKVNMEDNNSEMDSRRAPRRRRSGSELEIKRDNDSKSKIDKSQQRSGKIVEKETKFNAEKTQLRSQDSPNKKGMKRGNLSPKSCASHNKKTDETAASDSDGTKLTSHGVHNTKEGNKDVLSKSSPTKNKNSDETDSPPAKKALLNTPSRHTRKTKETAEEEDIQTYTTDSDDDKEADGTDTGFETCEDDFDKFMFTCMEMSDGGSSVQDSTPDGKRTNRFSTSPANYSGFGSRRVIRKSLRRQNMGLRPLNTQKKCDYVSSLSNSKNGADENSEERKGEKEITVDVLTADDSEDDFKESKHSKRLKGEEKTSENNVHKRNTEELKEGGTAQTGVRQSTRLKQSEKTNREDIHVLQESREPGNSGISMATKKSAKMLEQVKNANRKDVSRRKAEEVKDIYDYDSETSVVAEATQTKGAPTTGSRKSAAVVADSGSPARKNHLDFVMGTDSDGTDSTVGGDDDGAGGDGFDRDVDSDEDSENNLCKKWVLKLSSMYGLGVSCVLKLMWNCNGDIARTIRWIRFGEFGEGPPAWNKNDDKKLLRGDEIFHLVDKYGVRDVNDRAMFLEGT